MFLNFIVQYKCFAAITTFTDGTTWNDDLVIANGLSQGPLKIWMEDFPQFRFMKFQIRKDPKTLWVDFLDSDLL
jgi:hypothetical protein